MLSLEIEIMTKQRNVQRMNVEDLTEAAIQKCFLKKVFFKESSILKTTCVYIHSPKITPSDYYFFQRFCFVCFEISEHFKNIYFTCCQ